MKKTLLITAIAAGAVIVVVTVVSYVITKTLIAIAIRRKGPKSIEIMRVKLAKTVRASDFQARINESAHALLEKNIEEVEITARDGVRLVGHFYPCDNAKRVIVAMHGWRSAWFKDFGMIADFWHNEGSSILFAEQRGQNKSGGDYMTFGYMERYDCLDWVNFVNGRTDGKYPVYLAGVSLGSSTVLMTAGLDLPENVRGVIADCGFTSAYGIWRHVVKENMKLSYGLRGKAIDVYCKKHIGATSKEISTVDAMRKTEVPILFIHGSDDKFVPIEMTYENYKACRAPKTLLVVPGAIHGQSYYVETEKYEEAVRALWKKCDGTENSITNDKEVTVPASVWTQAN